ncbi:hypothetical protein FRC02_007829, partial [Tulasnella sp. 418]
LGITEFLDTLVRGLQVEEQAPEVIIVIDTEPSLNLQKGPRYESNKPSSSPNSAVPVKIFKSLTE